MTLFQGHRIKVTATTSGLGDFGLGSASGAFHDFSQANVPDGAVVDYVAFTATEFECGSGRFNISGMMLVRDVVTASGPTVSPTNSHVNFSTPPTIAITFLPKRLPGWGNDLYLEEFTGIRAARDPLSDNPADNPYILTFESDPGDTTWLNFETGSWDGDRSIFEIHYKDEDPASTFGVISFNFEDMSEGGTIELRQQFGAIELSLNDDRAKLACETGGNEAEFRNDDDESQVQINSTNYDIHLICFGPKSIVFQTNDIRRWTIDGATGTLISEANYIQFPDGFGVLVADGNPILTFTSTYPLNLGVSPSTESPSQAYLELSRVITFILDDEDEEVEREFFNVTLKGQRQVPPMGQSFLWFKIEDNTSDDSGFIFGYEDEDNDGTPGITLRFQVDPNDGSCFFHLQDGAENSGGTSKLGFSLGNDGEGTISYSAQNDDPTLSLRIRTSQPGSSIIFGTDDEDDANPRWEIRGTDGYLVAEPGVHLITTDDPYGAGWNGNFEVPTKNAIYDKIESLSLGGITWPQAVADGAVFVSLDSPTTTLLALDNVSSDAVHYITIANAVLDEQPRIRTGPAGNISLSLHQSGTGIVFISNDAGAPQFKLTSDTPGVDASFALEAGVALLETQGLDLNILAEGQLDVEGNLVQFKSSQETRFSVYNAVADDYKRVLELVDSGGADPVNYITFTNAPTDENPKITASGADSHIGITFQSKGEGTFGFHAAGQADNEIFGAFLIRALTAAVSPGGAQDGFGVAIEFALENFDGDDIYQAGRLAVYTHDAATGLATFQVNLFNSIDTVTALEVVGADLGANHLSISNAQDGAHPRISAVGESDDIDVELKGKGEGWITVVPNDDGFIKFRLVDPGDSEFAFSLENTNARLETAGADLRLQCADAFGIAFWTDDTLRWSIDANGAFSNNDSIDHTLTISCDADALFDGLTVANGSFGSNARTRFFVISGTDSVARFTADHDAAEFFVYVQKGSLNLLTEEALGISFRTNDTARWTVDGTSGDLIAEPGVNLITTDEAYGPGWNGNFEVPTKNAIYDKIESLSLGGITWPQAVPDGLVFVSNDSPNAPLLALNSVSGDAINYLTIANSLVDEPVRIIATGMDTDIGFEFETKNEGRVRFIRPEGATDEPNTVAAFIARTTGTPQVDFGARFRIELMDLNDEDFPGAVFEIQYSDVTLDAEYTVLNFRVAANGVEAPDAEPSLQLLGAADGVNYIEITNAPADAAPSITVAGADAEIELMLRPKGGANVVVGANEDGDGKLRVSDENNHNFQFLANATRLYLNSEGGTFRIGSNDAHDVEITVNDEGSPGGVAWIFDESEDGSLVAASSQFIQMNVMLPPSNAPAGAGRTFFQDNGAGKVQWCVRFPTGAVQVLAEED